MAIISASTFNPLQCYVNVRMQQGVPIVDADLNELDDVRKFELRAYLKWFVGDGIPDGNDGFRIVGAGLANDFTISSGLTTPPAAGAAPIDTALHHVGRIIIDGLDVMIAADMQFSAQQLHENQPGAAALATRLGVPRITALSAPAANGVVTVYLDVWERLVTPDENPHLIAPGLGVESCARIKREWVVRVRAGGLPAPGAPDYLADHLYTALAQLTRRNGDAKVQSFDVADLRQRRLIMPPATLIEDVLGVSASNYRSGQGRPPISLREAVNALLRGEIPATSDAAVFSSNGRDLLGRSVLFDTSGGLLAVWTSESLGGQDQAVAARLDLAHPGGGFSQPPQALTTTDVVHEHPSAVLLPNGDLLIAYQENLAANADVLMKQGRLGALGDAIPVAATAGVGEISPFVTVSGDIATIFLFRSAVGANRWQYRRRNHVTKTWMDAAGPVDLSANPTNVQDLHAAVDAAGKVWVAFVVGNNIQAMQLDPGNGIPSNQMRFEDAANPAVGPFVLPTTQPQGVWVFWYSTSGGIFARFFTASTSVWSNTITAAAGVAGQVEKDPCAICDAEGAIWVIWSRGPSDGKVAGLVIARGDPHSGTWGKPRQLTSSSGADTGPAAVVAPDGAAWVLWQSDRSGVAQNLYYKRFVTSV
jgi:hypothetical protein